MRTAKTTAQTATAAVAFAIFSVFFITQARAAVNVKVKPVLDVGVRAGTPPTEIHSAKSAHNFLVGVAEIGRRQENGTQCGQELEVLLKAVAAKEVWMLKVLDSFGQPPESFIWGNYFWFSGRHLCEELNEPFSVALSHGGPAVKLFNTTSPFPMRLTMVYFRFNTPYYIDLKMPFENFIHLGLCLPRSCSANALRLYSDLFFQRNVFDMQKNFQLEMKVVEAKNPRFDWSFFKQTGSLLVIAGLLLVISLTVLAELLHRSKKNLQEQQKLHHKTAISTLMTALPTTTLSNDKKPTINDEVQREVEATFEALLLSFSFRDNWREALKLESSKNFLSCLAGMRTIICLWVAMFHVYYYSLYAMTNVPMIFAKLEAFALQPVLQACFYVDVFFVMSAFLLVYKFLENEAQMEKIRKNSCWPNVKLFGRTIFQRYIRLTPVLLVTMLISVVVYDFLRMYSPFRFGTDSDIYCKHNWWRNLLYIQNLSAMSDICCSWTWYLSCEMQFFVLFTALLFLYAKNAQAGQIAFATLALGCAVTGWLCNYRNGVTFQIDVIYSTLDQLYVKPWVRINPYVGGAALGWLMHRKRQQQQQKPGHQKHQESTLNNNAANSTNINIPAACLQDTVSSDRHAVWRAAFWIGCSLLYVVTNFMSYWRGAPVWLVATIMSFGKLLFAACVGGVIVLCSRGRGGPLNALLSAPPFLFLAKFCYSIYMLAPIAVIFVFGWHRATTFTEISSGMYFLAIILLSMLAAFLLFVFVELPMQRITKVLMRSKQPPNENVVNRQS